MMKSTSRRGFRRGHILSESAVNYVCLGGPQAYAHGMLSKASPPSTIPKAQLSIDPSHCEALVTH